VHEVVRKLRRCDILPVLGIGLILEMAPARIRYVIAGGFYLPIAMRNSQDGMRAGGERSEA